MEFILGQQYDSVFLLEIEKIYDKAESTNFFITKHETLESLGKDLSDNDLSSLTRVDINTDRVIIVHVNDYTKRSLVHNKYLTTEFSASGEVIPAEAVNLDKSIYLSDSELKRNIISFNSLEDAKLYAIAAEDKFFKSNDDDLPF